MEKQTNNALLLLLQSLVTCKCKIFLGSVDEMKGNEARVVIFLHAVEKFKEGRVKREEQSVRMEEIGIEEVRMEEVRMGELRLEEVRMELEEVRMELEEVQLEESSVQKEETQMEAAPTRKRKRSGEKKEDFVTKKRIEKGPVTNKLKAEEVKEEGKSKETVLLHTQPYYLAITRSSCEVILEEPTENTFCLIVKDVINAFFIPFLGCK